MHHLKMEKINMNPIKEIYYKIFPPREIIFKNELSGCDSVLDLGCGPDSWIQVADVKYSVGVELFEPYIVESKKKGIHDEYVHSDIRDVNFKENSFDAVVCVDVIEHLTKNEGIDLIKKMDLWARKKVVLFTPNGFVHQEIYDNNSLQLHKSGWNSHEFEELGFKSYGFGWKQLMGTKAEFKYKPEILWQIFTDITRKLPYYFINQSFMILAVKRMDD